MEWTERDDEAFIRAILKSELHFLCVQAIYARTALEEALKHRGRPVGVWLVAQGILVIGANASKLLWGKGAARARKALRAEAGVHDDSPLRSKDIRNAFEHIDERIVGWARKEGKHYVERHVIWDGERSPAGSQFGTFDSKTWTIDFLDEEPISLRAVLDELDRIGPRIHPLNPTGPYVQTDPSH